jgi:hypothetical protein
VRVCVRVRACACVRVRVRACVCACACACARNDDGAKCTSGMVEIYARDVRETMSRAQYGLILTFLNRLRASSCSDEVGLVLDGLITLWQWYCVLSLRKCD